MLFGDEPRLPAALGRAGAQPPGGRSSFMFNDGSDARVRRYDEPARANNPCIQQQQPPGGRTSFAFDDSVSRAGGGDVERRHTNGLRKIQPFNTHAPPDYVRQAPGGRSSFSFDDGSTNHYQPPPPPPPPRTMDAIDGLLSAQPTPYGRQQPPQVQPAPYATAADVGNPAAGHRASMAPPGGRSTFSVGWGFNDDGNHHHHFSRRNGQDAARAPFAAPLANSNNASMHVPPSDFAAKFQQQPQAYGGGGGGGFGQQEGAAWGGGSAGMGGGGGYVRPSVHVAAPPGGRSSIVFG